MTDSPSPSQWINLAECDDPRDVVHRAVACLAQGGVVGLGLETVYCLAASALNPAGVAKLRSLRGESESRPLTILLKGPEETTDWVSLIPESSRRLVRRLWPGPVTLLFSKDSCNGLYHRLPAEVKPLISPERRHRPALSGRSFDPSHSSVLAGTSGAQPRPSRRRRPRRNGRAVAVDAGPRHGRRLGADPLRPGLHHRPDQ